MRFETAQQVHAFLDSMPGFRTSGRGAADFDLDRFRRYCRAAGDPGERFPSIYVAGTNGKGSTCALLASAYSEGGYRTGLYTSPHLERVHERFRLDGRMIDDEALLAFFREQEALVTAFRLTYFELTTAIAFWWFDRMEVDLAVIETGLGGRLDATNVITPLLSVITNVSLDHTDLLGNTVPDIAREKAGIIKPGVPVLTGNVAPDALQVVRDRAEECGSAWHGIDGLEYSLRDGRFRLEADGETFEARVGPLPPVQAHNLAMAWKSVRLLGDRFPMPDDRLAGGLESAPGRVPTPARFEKLHPELEWYFDGAHNPEAVRALKEAVSQRCPVSGTVLVLSMMKDKVGPEVAGEFLEFKKIYYYELETARSAGAEQLTPLLPEISVIPSRSAERDSLLRDLQSELVIFAGSFYFYPTIREWIISFSRSR